MSEFGIRKATFFIAFIGVILASISIVVGKWVAIFNEVALIIALLTMVICAFFYVKAKRNPAYMIIYVLCVAFIIGFKVWGFIA